MIYLIVGTRPDLVKMAPVIHALKEKNVPFKVVHTGQHYSKNLDQDLRNELNIQIDYRLQVTIGRGVDASVHTIYEQFCKYLASNIVLFSDIVVVYGDTFSALACAMAAKTMGCQVFHAEAGLRSNDLTMPEEVARISIDAMSDRLYAPTYAAYENLRSEHFPQDRILITGNTVVNALHSSMAKTCVTKDTYDLLASHGITGSFALLTLHRPENVNSDLIFYLCLRSIEYIAAERELQRVLFVCHPRTTLRLASSKVDLEHIQTIDPVPHHIMLGLIQESEFVMTDSGGMQEECALLDKKCITYRKSTERPETVDSGHNILLSPYTHDFLTTDYGMWEACEHLDNQCVKDVSYGTNPAILIASDLMNWRTPK